MLNPWFNFRINSYQTELWKNDNKNFIYCKYINLVEIINSNPIAIIALIDNTLEGNVLRLYLWKNNDYKYKVIITDVRNWFFNKEIVKCKTNDIVLNTITNKKYVSYELPYVIPYNNLTRKYCKIFVKNNN